MCYHWPMSTTAFAELDDYLNLPRVTALAASADGRRVVMALAELNDKKTEFRTALWELDPGAAEGHLHRLVGHLGPHHARRLLAPSNAVGEGVAGCVGLECA